jgi:hypothetical protein
VSGHLNAIHRAIYGSPYPEGHEDAWLSRYRGHNADVQAYFAERPDDLLVLRLEDGLSFEKVCAFLGKPVVAWGIPVSNTHLKKKFKTLWWRLKKRLRR